MNKGKYNCITLPDEFSGRGEVVGFNFKKIKETDSHYLFEVSYSGNKHYEIIKKTTSPLCIDFSKKVYSDTDFKEVYPKAHSFGTLGWTVKKYEGAVNLLYTKTLEYENRDN